MLILRTTRWKLSEWLEHECPDISRDSLSVRLLQLPRQAEVCHLPRLEREGVIDKDVSRTRDRVGMTGRLRLRADLRPGGLLRSGLRPSACALPELWRPAVCEIAQIGVECSSEPRAIRIN